MAAYRHQQRGTWGQDRLRKLSLGECVHLDGEQDFSHKWQDYEDKDVTKASGHVVNLRRRLGDLETTVTERRLRDSEENKRRHRESRYEITHLKGELQQQVAQSNTWREEIIHLKREIQSLKSTVVALSTQVGSLQDKDVTEASGHVVNLMRRLGDLEPTVTERRLRDSEENKRRHRESRYEITHLKEELQQQVAQSNTWRDEILRLQREIQLLREDLASAGAQRCVTELRAQVNRLEAEVEEQRRQKQTAILEKEHMRMEVEALRSASSGVYSPGQMPQSVYRGQLEQRVQLTEMSTQFSGSFAGLQAECSFIPSQNYTRTQTFTPPPSYTRNPTQTYFNIYDEPLSTSESNSDDDYANTEEQRRDRRTGLGEIQHLHRTWTPAEEYVQTRWSWNWGILKPD